LLGQESEGMIRNTEDPKSTGHPPDTNRQTIAVEASA